MKENEKLACTIDLKAGFTHVLFNLFAQGYSHICIEYSGGGDSGAIDLIRAFKLEDLEINEETGEVENWKGRGIQLENDLLTLVDNEVTRKILDTADDWWNNEGGGGTLWLDCRDGSYRGNHYVRVTETIDSELSGKLND